MVLKVFTVLTAPGVNNVNSVSRVLIDC